MRLIASASWLRSNAELLWWVFRLCRRHAGRQVISGRITTFALGFFKATQTRAVRSIRRTYIARCRWRAIWLHVRIRCGRIGCRITGCRRGVRWHDRRVCRRRGRIRRGRSRIRRRHRLLCRLCSLRWRPRRLRALILRARRSQTCRRQCHRQKNVSSHESRSVIVCLQSRTVLQSVPVRNPVPSVPLFLARSASVMRHRAALL